MGAMVRGGPSGEAQLVAVRAATTVTAVVACAAATVDGGAQTLRAVEGCCGTVQRRMVAVARCGHEG
jgi:hypothetical protein